MLALAAHILRLEEIHHVRISVSTLVEYIIMVLMCPTSVCVCMCMYVFMCEHTCADVRAVCGGQRSMLSVSYPSTLSFETESPTESRAHSSASPGRQ